MSRISKAKRELIAKEKKSNLAHLEENRVFVRAYGDQRVVIYRGPQGGRIIAASHSPAKLSTTLSSLKDEVARLGAYWVTDDDKRPDEDFFI